MINCTNFPMLCEQLFSNIKDSPNTNAGIKLVHQRDSPFCTLLKFVVLYCAAGFSGQDMHVPYKWIINTHSWVTQSY